MAKWNIEDLGQLTLDIYNNPSDRGGDGWKSSHKAGDTDSGLKIDTYTKDGSNVRIIAIAGTDFELSTEFLKDIRADSGFVTGKVTDQVKDALEYVAKQLDAAGSASGESGESSPEFILTGHSLENIQLRN